MSTIKATTLSNLAGSKTVPTDTVVDGSAKAWVNFNGTGTVAIRRAFNVSSITDNGTGDYTVNFTNAMVDANYSIVGSVGKNVAGLTANTPTNATTPTTSACRISSSSTAVYQDVEQMNVSIFS